MVERPKVSSSSEKELDKAQKQFQAFDEEVKSLTLDRMNAAPKEETKPLEISQNQIAKSKDIYIKPKRTISSKEPFNEKYRDEYEFQKQFVYFTAVNNEIIGESLNFWTKKFAGIPAEEWDIPVNKPVWCHRYVAERIKGCTYHRLKTEDRATDNTGVGTMYGQIVVDTTVQRLDAIPATKTKSIFMGSDGF